MFVNAFLRTGKVRDSALEAGYSASFASSKAYQLLDNPDVQSMIANVRKKVELAAVVGSAEVINELARVAMVRATDLMYYDDDPAVMAWVGKPPDQLTDEQKAAVKRVKALPVYHIELPEPTTENPKPKPRTVLVKNNYDYILHDKLEALLAIGNHFGIFEQEGNDAGSINFNIFNGLTEEQLKKLRYAFETQLKEIKGEQDGETYENGESVSADRGSS